MERKQVVARLPEDLVGLIDEDATARNESRNEWLERAARLRLGGAAPPLVGVVNARRAARRALSSGAAKSGVRPIERKGK